MILDTGATMHIMSSELVDIQRANIVALVNQLTTTVLVRYPDDLMISSVTRQRIQLADYLSQ